MLILSADIQETIRQHALREYPHECCGILLGEIPPSPAATLARHALPAPNTAPPDTRKIRYLIDPVAILHADTPHRAEHLDIVGFYHSHPDHPAAPSPTDLSLAWPDYIYLIAAVTAAGACELRAWRLLPDGAMHEIPIRAAP